MDTVSLHDTSVLAPYPYPATLYENYHLFCNKLASNSPRCKCSVKIYYPMKFYFTSQEKSWGWGGYPTLNEHACTCIYVGSIHCINKLLCAPLHAVTEMLVNVLSLKDDDLADEGDEKIKPGSGIYIHVQ